MPTLSPTDRLIAGYRTFQTEYYHRRPQLFETLSTGQAETGTFVAAG